MAGSSAVEVDTQLEISGKPGYFMVNQIDKLDALLTSVFKMLSKMITNLEYSSY